MNTKNLLIASLIGAVVTTFFANFPVINFINCLVCLPFWVDHFWQYGSISVRQAP